MSGESFYTVKVRCMNCGYYAEMTSPRKQPVKSHDCPECECKTLHPAWQDPK